MIEIFGIVISLLGLMYFAYQGVNVLFLAPIMGLVAVAFHSGAPLMATYTQIYMPALGMYLLKYFPLFMLGAIFGRLMNDTGSASIIGQAIAKKLGPNKSILATVLACAALTYGGVSLFVVAFCIYPIAVQLFQVDQVPKRLIPASIALGSFTFTMTALPGTPSIQNAIPMPYFGTTSFAAPGLGIIAALIMFFGGMAWLNWRSHRAKLKGEGYSTKISSDAVTAQNKLNVDASIEEAHLIDKTNSKRKLIFAFSPLLMVLVLNYLFSRVILPELDLHFLSDPKYGATSGDKVIGLWALIVSLSLAILFILATQKRNLAKPVHSINTGTMESLLPIFNTASEVGYGATIASLASFIAIKNGILSVAPTNPLISEAISINMLAGITGSASGGMSIALEALGPAYMKLAEAANISPQLLHRVATLSCGGFDTLPHNGAVITLLGICGLTHRTSYYDIFIIAVALPFFATIAVVTLGTFFGSF